MTFTEKLDALMKQNSLNKSSLSKACGIPYTTIDGWYKKGCSDLKVSSLKKLTSYFGLSLDYWLDDEYEENKKSPEPEGPEDETQEISELEEELRSVLLKHGVLKNGDLTSAEADFLEHVFALIALYFKK